jgi:hypothetical protein
MTTTVLYVNVYDRSTLIIYSLFPTASIDKVRFDQNNKEFLSLKYGTASLTAYLYRFEINLVFFFLQNHP